MKFASVFKNNATQAVRLPVEARFPEGTRQLKVRVVGKDRILSPVDASWDSFFLQSELPSDDFMNERPSQTQSDRESF